MSRWPEELQSLLAVAVCVVDERGLLVSANAGFLRLLPAGTGMAAAGTRVSHFFIQPTFADLLRTAHAPSGTGYRGLLTVGDYAGTTRTLIGQVTADGPGLRMLAEHDIVELERINMAIGAMNADSLLAQRKLVGENLALERRQGELTQDALTDALTGVSNRRKLEQALEVEVARVGRTGSPLCAVMVDIDHFKRVNDDFGHSAGDVVLACLGRLLRASTRPTDEVARFGGEEFVLLLPGATLAQGAGKAEQLRLALAALRIEPVDRPITASFGVVQLQPGENGRSLLGRADAALYLAKSGGRNQVVAAGSPD